MHGLLKHQYNIDMVIQFSASYPARCDFETSLCSWSQDKTDNFDWTRANDHTASYGTGPSRDHTRGTALGNIYILVY